MKQQVSQSIMDGMAELMARRGRLVPLPGEFDQYDFDPQDVKECSSIAARETMKHAYREHFDGFMALVNNMKTQLGKELISDGNEEDGHSVLNFKFSQDEVYDMLFSAMGEEE